VEILLNPLAGFFVGLLVGMTGVGGGAMMTPLLILIFGVAPSTAVGTDLLFSCITKCFGVWSYRSYSNIDWSVVRLLAFGSIPAALATVIWLNFFDGMQVKQGLVLTALGTVLLITSAAMIFKTRLNRFGKRLRSTAPVEFKSVQPALTVLAGAILGVLVSLTSIGAGALGAVMLVYLYPFRLTPRKLVGTDLAHAIPLALIAGIGHLAIGNVDFRLLVSLLLGSIPGILIGARLSVYAPEAILRTLIAIILAVVGLKLLH
jgi:uncharacterized membrane protein YfcA